MSAEFQWANIFRKRGRDNIEELLRRVPIFDALTARDVRALEKILHFRSYAEDEMIFHEGDDGLAMYIIDEGEVSIFRGTSDQEIVRLGSGDFFGEIGLFSTQPRSASARAMCETRVFGFSQPDLLGLLETQPRVGISILLKLTRILAERLERATIDNERLHAELASYTGT